jgi:2-keto-4-pentenoate hydratase
MDTSAPQTTQSIRINKAAKLLAWARQNGSRLEGLPPDASPRDLNEAYEMQLAAARLRPSPNAGFKIGLTSEQAQRSADTFAPIVGRLALPDVRRSRCRLELPENHLRVVEAEIVFELGDDLPEGHAPYSEQRVAACLSRAFAGIELCDTRFTDRVEFSLPSLVADNSNAHLLIVGDPLAEEDMSVLSELPVTLQLRGKPPIRGSTGNVLGDPLRALTWLANWLARRGEGLQRGQLVSSGSCTGMTEVAPDDAVVATFGKRTSVTVEFVPQNRAGEVRK